MLQISLFGQLHVLWNGAPHPLRGLPKTLPLWAYLLLHRQRPLTRERLAFTFWPDASEEAARTNLRRHLHDLHRALPAAPPDAAWLLLEGETVQWNPHAPYWLDVAEFERPRRLLDVACGCAIKSLILAQRDPALHVTGVDTPRVLPVARDLAERMGLTAQAEFVAADLLTAAGTSQPSCKTRRATISPIRPAWKCCSVALA